MHFDTISKTFLLCPLHRGKDDWEKEKEKENEKRPMIPTVVDKINDQQILSMVAVSWIKLDDAIHFIIKQNKKQNIQKTNKKQQQH